MADQVVQVPVSLLLSPVVTPAGKLVGSLSGPGPAVPPYRLSRLAGLARNTVLRALAELKAVGTQWEGPAVPVPAALLTDPRLGIQARLLYGALLTLPGFGHSCGTFTYECLAEIARVDLKTARKAIRELVEAEWIRVEQTNRLQRIWFALVWPGLEQELNRLALAEWRLEKAEYHGEALMREYLSLLVDSDQFEDNATPGWLINPRTGEELQLDRFYPPQVAFEFNGAQHYRKTRRFSREHSVAQRERDCIKLGLCAERRVSLVVVHPEDLSADRMRRKVGSLLPPRDLAGYGALLAYLDDEGDRYRRKVEHL